MKVSIITPTCDRPAGITLCQKWMARQTIQPDEWIVADGGIKKAPLTCGQKHIWHPRPLGVINFTSNVIAGLESATGDIIVIVEDDDWYAPDHIEKCINGLKQSTVYGCPWLNYYHVGVRRWVSLRNIGSALCQTAIRKSESQRLINAAQVAQVANKFNLDGIFWSGRQDAAQGEQTVIGIKGLSGTKGLGMGHAPFAKSIDWKDDPTMARLRAIIGNDADCYEEFFNG